MAQILSAGSSGISQAYTTIQEAGSSLTQRSLLNVVGSALIATDDSGGSRTQLTAATALNSIASGTWAGASSITTLGTIATGIWNGTDITVPYGGTGLTSTTAYAVLCGGTTSTAALQSIASVGTSGQVLTSNGAGALPTFQAAGGGGITSVVRQIFTSSGTYTPTSGMAYCYVECVGGGAGGGGTASPNLQATLTAPGGGAGGYAASLLTAATIGASQAVTIGTGGAGGNNTTGGSGGNSSLGSLVIGNGAGASGYDTNDEAVTAGNNTGGNSVGGSGTGDLVIPGQGGGTGISVYIPVDVAGVSVGGDGGRSFLGSGTRAIRLISLGGHIDGASATAYGDGGAGGSSLSSSAGRGATTTGGNGHQGIVIITEYVG